MKLQSIAAAAAAAAAMNGEIAFKKSNFIDNENKLLIFFRYSPPPIHSNFHNHKVWLFNKMFTHSIATPGADLINKAANSISRSLFEISCVSFFLYYDIRP
jgi:hypothetical protein